MLFFLLLEKVTLDHGTKSHTDQIHPLGTNVLKPVCSDTEIAIFVFVIKYRLGTAMFILLSCISILCTMLRTPSSWSRSKVFHTCASCLMALSLFNGMVFFMYLCTEDWKR